MGDDPDGLHRAESEVCGAVEVAGHAVLRSALDLQELDQDGVLAADATGDRGLVLEYLTDPIGFGAPTFKLLAWVGYHTLAER